METVAVTVPVPKDMHESMKIFAKSRGLSLAAFFRQAGVKEMESVEFKKAA